jgi:hypothetical protein
VSLTPIEISILCDSSISCAKLGIDKVSVIGLEAVVLSHWKITEITNSPIVHFYCEPIRPMIHQLTPTFSSMPCSEFIGDLRILSAGF